MPQLASLYCYSSNRTNLIAGINKRYPTDRPALSDSFCEVYANFIVNAVRHAPTPLFIDATIDDVPLQYTGQKRE